MFELLCLAFGLQYGLILYLQPNRFLSVKDGPATAVPLSWESTFSTLPLAALGIGSLIAGYYLGGHWGGRLRLLRRLPRVDLPLKQPRLGWYWCFAFAAGVAALLVSARGLIKPSGALAALTGLLAAQAYVGLLLLTDYVYRQRKGWRWKAGLYALLALMCLVGMTTGMQEIMLMPIVFVFIARWLAVGSIPWRLLLAGGLLFVVLYPLKFRYRSAAWAYHKPDAAESFTARAVIWGRVLADFAREAAGGRAQLLSARQLQDTLYRFDLLHLFVLIRDKTPGEVPYYRGASYQYLLYAWVPRAFWPGKPAAQGANNNFALDYGIMGREEVGHSMFGIGQLAESYANFGVAGLILVMGLKGLFFAALNGLLNGKGSHGGRMIYVVLLVPFFNGINSNAAGMFGGVVQNAAAHALLLRPFAKSFSAAPSAPGRSEGAL
jgi:voltage-gated potassium channel Kch